jgi:hypothetical protein
MPDPTLLPAIRAALRYNELGGASPYVLSYACLGQSGASFGVFQADTNTNETAREAVRAALWAAGMDQGHCHDIVVALSQRCPNGSPLSRDDAAAVDAALSSPAGRTLVDFMDESTLQIVLGELNTSVAAAATGGMAIDDEAQLYIALWVNMTGAPDTLNRWLSGTNELGDEPPAGPTVTAADVAGYLRHSVFFRLHPRNFAHMRDSVNQALPLLAG